MQVTGRGLSYRTLRSARKRLEDSCLGLGDGQAAKHPGEVAEAGSAPIRELQSPAEGGVQRNVDGSGRARRDRAHYASCFNIDGHDNDE